MCVYKIDHVFLLLYFIFYFCFCSECCACRQSRLKPQGYHFLKLRVFRRCRSDEKEEECRCVWERHIHSYSFIITISRRLRMSFSLFSWASNVQLNKIHLCLTFLCFPPFSFSSFDKHCCNYTNSSSYNSKREREQRKDASCCYCNCVSCLVQYRHIQYTRTYQ